MFGSLLEMTRMGTELATFDVRTTSDDELAERTVTLERFASQVAAARLHALAELEARGHTNVEHGLTTAPWVAREAERSAHHVRRDLKTGTRLRERLTEIDDALTAGVISIDHARVISEACNDRNIDGMELLQAEMISGSIGAVFDQWRRDIARLAQLLDEDGSYDPNADLARNQLRKSEDLEGVGHLRVTLTPELYAIVSQLLEDRANGLFRRYQEIHKLDPDVAIPHRGTLLALALFELCREGATVDLESSAEPRIELSLILRSFGISVTDDTADDDEVRHARSDGRTDADNDETSTAAGDRNPPAADDRAHGEGGDAEGDDPMSSPRRHDDPAGNDEGDADATGDAIDDWWEGAFDGWDDRDDPERGDGRVSDEQDQEGVVVYPAGLGPQPDTTPGLGHHRQCPHRCSIAGHRPGAGDDPGRLLRHAMRSVGQHPGAAVFDRDGASIPDSVLHHLLCDPDMYTIIVDSLGVPVDMGRKIRFANRAQRRAIASRDGGCVFPGCDKPVHWSHAHHTEEYEHGGCTDVRLLASLCAFHHGVVHRHGWDMHLEADGWFWFETPNGRTFWAQRRYKRRSDPPPSARLLATG